MEQAYTLDGTEVSSDRQTPNGVVTTKMKSEQIGNKVIVTNIFPTPNGEMKTTMTYELSADGKTMTVTRESSRGSAKHVYTKAS
jgi:formyltetrahydrofolate synthetase